MAVDAIADPALVAAIAATQTAIRLGRTARAKAGPPVSKFRQPLAEAVVAAPASLRGALEDHAAEIAAELNVKRVRVVEDAAEIVTIELVPNFRAVGKRLGKAVPEVQRLLRRGRRTSARATGSWSAATSSARATTRSASARGRA